MSSGLDAAANGTAILSALSGMEMLARAGYTVSASEYRDNNRNDYFPAPLLTALCSPYAINNMTIVMRGKTGNAPLLGVWSSVVGNLNPLEYDSSNTTTTRGGIESIVSVQGYDGRDDVVEICNGLGMRAHTCSSIFCATALTNFQASVITARAPVSVPPITVLTLPMGRVGSCSTIPAEIQGLVAALGSTRSISCPQPILQNTTPSPTTRLRSICL